MSVAVDEIELRYDGCGRITYHPKIHFNQGKPVTEDEKEYLCTYYKIDGRRSMSYALGRTEATIMNLYFLLKKKGLVEYYRSRYLARFE